MLSSLISLRWQLLFDPMARVSQTFKLRVNENLGFAGHGLDVLSLRMSSLVVEGGSQRAL